MASQTNSQLLYSEYMDVNETDRAVNLLASKREKPSMVFSKSEVLSRVKGLLPKMKEAESHLNDESNLDIEVCDEGEAFIQMNVGLVAGLDENLNACFENEDSDSEESDSEQSVSESIEAQNTLDSIINEIKPMMDPSIKIYSKRDSEPTIAARKSEATQEIQQVMPDAESPRSLERNMEEDLLDARNVSEVVWRPWE